MSDNTIVRGVWWGPKLTNIQKLCIRSYQDHGHEFHLYTAEPVQGVPAGTIIHSVEEVVPASDRNRFTCESHFSDWFRVNLIHKYGGWYVDLDTICLRHFDFEQDFVFVSENEFGAARDPKLPPIPPSHTRTALINGCIFKAPASSAFTQWIIDRINAMDTHHPASWISVGPQMFRDAVPHFGYEKYVYPPVTFDGVSPNELHHFVTDTTDKNWQWHLDQSSYVIHLRTSAWGENRGLSPDKVYHVSSLYEQLKRKHVVTGGIVKPKLNLAETVQPYTMAGNKINLIIDLASRLDGESVHGDVVECGVCNGGAAAVLAHYAAQSRFNRRTWLFDSFQGLPPVTKEDLPETQSGRPASTVVGQCVGSIDIVKEVLGKVGADMNRVTIVPGWFQDTLPTVDIPEIAMLNLDSDWYESEKLCLEKFYDRVSFGGYIYFDDFYYWPGCRHAAEEFFEKRSNEYPQIFHQFEHSMWLQKQTQEELIKLRRK